MVVHRFSHTATYSSYSSFLLRLSMGPKPEYSLRTLCPCRGGKKVGKLPFAATTGYIRYTGNPREEKTMLTILLPAASFRSRFLGSVVDIWAPFSFWEGERKGGVEWWKTPSFFGSFCLGTSHFSPCRLGYTIALGGDHHTACLLVQNVALNVSTTKASEEKNK